MLTLAIFAQPIEAFSASPFRPPSFLFQCSSPVFPGPESYQPSLQDTPVSLLVPVDDFCCLFFFLCFRFFFVFLHRSVKAFPKLPADGRRAVGCKAHGSSREFPPSFSHLFRAENSRLRIQVLKLLVSPSHELFTTNRMPRSSAVERPPPWFLSEPDFSISFFVVLITRRRNFVSAVKGRRFFIMASPSPLYYFSFFTSLVFSCTLNSPSGPAPSASASLVV